MNNAEFQEHLWRSSVPLVRLSDERLPTGIASGCLIDYFGKRVLLTVSHATGDKKNWAIQLKYVPGKGTKTYQLGAMQFLAKGTLSSLKLEDIDFSYVEVPSNIRGYRQEIEAQEDRVKSEIPISIHASDLNQLPSSEETFGFCGMVMPSAEEHFGQVYFGSELRIYSGLSLVRTEGDYHVFSLPVAHPGHEHFKGCSGAPIFSSKGSLVALVCKGCKKTNEIWGISVRAYKTPIDILVGNVAWFVT